MAGVFVVGVGPGVGKAVAQRFAREGLPVGLVARSASVHALAAQLHGVPVAAVTADSTDEAGLRSALDRIAGKLGPPDVVVYNAALIRPDRIGELPANEYLRAWAVNVGGAITTAAHTLAGMAERGGGSYLVTSGMPEPKPEYVTLSLGKANLRTLVELLDKEYGSRGVHVASVTIDGPVAEGTPFDPALIAEHYWTLHAQPRDAWTHEAVHAG